MDMTGVRVISEETAIHDFARIVDKLDKLDVFGILDMLDEPSISVIEDELDKAAKVYVINRSWYPAYKA